LLTSLFIHPHRQKSDLYAPTSNSCIFTPIENWTHVYMNLFTRNSPYYHHLKYLLFLLKHPVYINCYMFRHLVGACHEWCITDFVCWMMYWCKIMHSMNHINFGKSNLKLTEFSVFCDTVAEDLILLQCYTV
jgi:hypothetical protein